MISFFSRDVLPSTHLGDCPWVKVKGAACIILTSINHSPHSVWDFSISVRIRTGRLCVVFDITFHQVEYKGRFFWAVPLKTRRKTFPVHLTFPYYILAVEFFYLFPSLIIFWLLKCGPRNVTRSTKDVRKKRRAHLPPPPLRVLRWLGWVSLVEWYAGGVLNVLVGLDAKNDVLVGAAPRLLAQEQTRGQARRLAHDRHVVRPPRLTVFVRHSVTPAGGAVPDALLGPDG